MSDFNDRLLLLLVAATGLLVLVVGWELALVEAVEVELPEWVEMVLFAAAALAFVLILAGIWFGLSRIDRGRN